MPLLTLFPPRTVGVSNYIQLDAIINPWLVQKRLLNVTLDKMSPVTKCPVTVPRNWLWLWLWLRGLLIHRTFNCHTVQFSYRTMPNLIDICVKKCYKNIMSAIGHVDIGHFGHNWDQPNYILVHRSLPSHPFSFAYLVGYILQHFYHMNNIYWTFWVLLE